MNQEEQIRQQLNSIVLPNSQRILATDKVVSEVKLDNAGVYIKLVFPYPIAHIETLLRESIEKVVQAVLSKDIKINLSMHTHIITHKVQPGVATIQGVKNIIAVASGKGGVGKSTTSANLAWSLASMGAKVGVLDADLYGPSQPTMLGVSNQQPEQRDKRFIPVSTQEGIEVMSIGFLVDTNQAVVWRGPMVSQALQQLLFQTHWHDIDYLIIDLPPGTGDIQLTLSQKIPVTGAVVVTTPQDIALIDARKAIDMFGKVNIPILGVLENMSVHVCSQCGHEESIFGADGGKQLAEQLSVPLLGQLPLNLPIRMAMDDGTVADLHHQYPKIAEYYRQAAWQLALAIADKGRDFSGRFPKIVVES